MQEQICIYILIQKSPQGSPDVPTGEYTNNYNLWEYAVLMVAKEIERTEHDCYNFIVCFRNYSLQMEEIKYSLWVIIMIVLFSPSRFSPLCLNLVYIILGKGPYILSINNSSDGGIHYF